MAKIPLDILVDEGLGYSHIPKVPTIPLTEGQKLKNLGMREIVNPINDIGGNIVQGTTKLAANVGNLGVNALNALGLNLPRFAPVTTKNNRVLRETIDPSDIGGNIVEGLSQYGPLGALGSEEAVSSLIGRGANSLIKNIAEKAPPSFLKNALAGFGTGLGASSGGPSNRLENAVTGAAAEGLVPQIVPGIKKGISIIKHSRLNPADILKDADDKVTSIYQDLSQGSDKKDLNAINNSNVAKNYETAVSNASNKYNDFLGNAEKEGFSPNVAKTYDPFTGKKEIINGKSIDISTPTKEHADALIEGKDKNLSPLSDEIKGKIENFYGFPSLHNAHDLQSSLGKEAQKLSSFNKTNEEKNTAYQLNDLRRKLNDDIFESVNKKGSDQLANQLKDASNYYKNNVVPYTTHADIRNVVKGVGKHKSNILNILSQTDEENAYNAIRSHIMQNPQQRNYLLAQQLSEGAPTELGESSKRLKLRDAEHSYAKAPDILKSMFPSDAVNALADIKHATNNILSKAERSKAIIDAGKRGLKRSGVVTGIGAGLYGSDYLADKLREIL